MFRCHSFYSKRYSRALYLGAKAIQLNSNSVQALLLKGAALRNMGRVQEAIIHFREAMRLAPCRLDCYEGRLTFSFFSFFFLALQIVFVSLAITKYK